MKPSAPDVRQMNGFVKTSIGLGTENVEACFFPTLGGDQASDKRDFVSSYQESGMGRQGRGGRRNLGRCDGPGHAEDKIGIQTGAS